MDLMGGRRCILGGGGGRSYIHGVLVSYYIVNRLIGTLHVRAVSRTTPASTYTTGRKGKKEVVTDASWALKT